MVYYVIIFDFFMVRLSVLGKWIMMFVVFVVYCGLPALRVRLVVYSVTW